MNADKVVKAVAQYRPGGLLRSGLSVRALGRRLGVGKSYVNQLEEGGRTASPEMVERWFAAHKGGKIVSAGEIPSRYEKLSRADADRIVRALSRVQAMILGLDRVNNINLLAGAGVLADGRKCIWLNSGKRVTFSLAGGVFTGSVTKSADPLAVPENRSREVTNVG